MDLFSEIKQWESIQNKVMNPPKLSVSVQLGDAKTTCLVSVFSY